NLLLNLVPTVNPRLPLNPLGLGNLERNVGFPLGSRRGPAASSGEQAPRCTPKGPAHLVFLTKRVRSPLILTHFSKHPRSGLGEPLPRWASDSPAQTPSQAAGSLRPPSTMHRGRDRKAGSRWPPAQ
ncbi:unnamed protein product, partial [Rangifer tarandus platyrhynchus]